LVGFFLQLIAGACTHKQQQGAVSSSGLGKEVADVVADRRIFQVTPATVAQQLGNIVELKAGEPGGQLLEFTGTNAKTGLRWARAEFQPSKPGSDQKWDLLQIRLGLMPPDGDYNALYEVLNSEITKRLGQPGSDASGSDGKRRSWSIASNQEVAIRDGTFESPLDQQREHIILIEIAVLQGEDEG
jgi:hypothetical protein